MRKVMFLFIVCLMTAGYSFDWYNTKEKISHVRPEIDQKDTMWCQYCPGYIYVWGVTAERAVKVNGNDFGIEYPFKLHAIDSFLYDPGYEYMYRVYDSDGTTLLWESATQTSADDYYNVVYVDPVLILKNDIYVSVVPLSGENPRLVSFCEVPTTHSYYGTAGAWNEFQSGGDYFEWCISFALSPYTSDDGPDIFAPILRKVKGLESFEGSDANIEITIQDMSTINSPMLGQYNLGSGWIDFYLTQSKGTYNFTGTVPGQPHGTTGIVKFYMEDNYGNAQWSDEYEITWSRDLPLLNEGFESDFPPAGWVQDTAGSGFVKATTMDGALVHSGEAVLCHWDTEVNNADWIWSPVITIPAANFCTVSFWQSSYWTSYYELHRMVVSTDGGSTFDVLYEGFPTEEEPDFSPWEQKKFTLKEYAGQDIQIGFYYQGNYCDQWFIDDVEVFYDYLPPVPIQLKGNDWLFIQGIIGAYLNNDMELELTVFDESGVDSVKAHYQFPYWFEPVDADMVYAGENVWTLTIPAELAETAGEIWFDMYDIGGNSATTSTYEIWFKEDHDPPPPPKLEGTIAFVNTPMYLILTLYDESPIDSCNGHYSKNGWVTQYDFEMTPSKIHEYTYSGTIPAESEAVLDGEVKFTIRDSAGNTLNTDSYMVQWLGGHTEIFEDFESGTGNWTLTGNWGLEEGTYTSATHALTESPDSNYTDNNISYAMWSNSMDWTMYFQGNIEFWCKYDLESDFDYMYFEGSGDNGMTWKRLKTWTGEGAGWHEENISMDGFAGDFQVVFRFYFESDGAVNLNGMYIDDIVINTQSSPGNPPIIIHDGPVHYEGASFSEQYDSSAVIFDISGIDSTRVYYQINGGQEQESEMVFVGDDTWNFSIPMTTVGNIVSYRIWARDASPSYEETITGYYTYISGDHLIYDSDIVSYYMTAEDNNAYAVSMSLDGLGSEMNLPFILIRNYYDASHISDSMEVHVWSDFGGLPGDELIDPIMVLPGYLGGGAPYTKIDLRTELTPFGPTVSNDFWVGFSAPYGSVYSLREAPNEEGTIAYGRSYKGTWNGTGWNWIQEPDDNYHFRAVVGERVGIDDHDIVPEIIALYQNYPNPFNPATKIEFDLTEDSEVILAVFDVAGRKVADIVNKKMNAGRHSVEFEASKMSSGVYYYSLKTGNSVQTKKMMLLR